MISTGRLLAVVAAGTVVLFSTALAARGGAGPVPPAPPGPAKAPADGAVKPPAPATLPPTPNGRVSPDLFGQQVDLVTPGYRHWSRQSGDTVDPRGDQTDFDNNFGEHAGFVDNPRLNSQAHAYGQGNVDEEFIYVQGADTVRWEFKVPGPGQYVIVLRPWRELRELTSAVVSYRSGQRWIDLPPIENAGHWGDYSTLVCYLIEVPAGQQTVPVVVRAQTGRCLLHRILLGRRREGQPWLADSRPARPSLYFTAADLPALREKVGSGPPKMAFDFMAAHAAWFLATLTRKEQQWQPEFSEYHVPRAIAQTAFLYAMTGRREHLDALGRMVSAVLDWPRSDSVIADQRRGFPILARARHLSAMALAYDWAGQAMPDPLRSRLRSLLDEEANRLYLYNETVAGCRESHGAEPWVAAGYGMAGLALAAEHRWAAGWVAGAKRVFRTNLAASYEDFGYFEPGAAKALEFAACLRSATGEDLVVAEAGRLRALLEYRLMLLEPGGVGYPSFGDAPLDHDPAVALALASSQKDGLALWYLNRLCLADASQMKIWAWRDVLPISAVVLYPTGLAESPPGPPRLPLARTWRTDPDVPPGLRGLTVLRTGHDRPEDVHVAVRGGDFTGWHGHPDQGGFTLTAFGDRMVQDRGLGAPYGAPASVFSKSAAAHSQTIVDGRGQASYNPLVYFDREAGRTGPLVHTPFVDYVAVEAAAAYRKNPEILRFERARRDFLFVRKPDRRAYLVVADDLQQDDRPRRYEWLLQTDTRHRMAAKGPGHYVITGKADLNVFTLAPKAVTMEETDHHDQWRTLHLVAEEPAVAGRFLHLLYPGPRGAAAPDIRRIEGPGWAGATVNGEETFVFAPGGQGATGGPLATDGRLAAVGRAGAAPEWALVVEGTRIEASGRRLLQSDRPVIAAINAAGQGCVVALAPAVLRVSLGGGPAQVIRAGAGTTMLPPP